MIPQASSTSHPMTMEAAGLALGVVALGLQLATTLQTYVEGVAGAEYRLRELSFDVASTASTLKQLEDILDADEAVTENTLSDLTATHTAIFTDQGRRDIHSLSRRCEKVYQGIVRVIVSASVSPSAKSKAIAANVGLSDLTVTRLMQFSRDLKWPWVDRKVKACQDELRWLKMDLLLHLQVATVAKVHLTGSSKLVTNADDDESTLEAVAERLIARRAMYRKTALEGRRQRKSPAYVASDETTRAVALPGQAGVSSKLASFLSSLAGFGSSSRPEEDSGGGSSRQSMSRTREATRDNVLITRPLHLEDEMDADKDLNHGTFTSDMLFQYPEEMAEKPLDGEKTTNHFFDIEAWTLPSPGAKSQRLPFRRGAILQRIQKATENSNASPWDQFFALTPQQRYHAQDVIVQSGEADARARSYLAVEVREDGEIIIFVAVSQHEEVVYLTDPTGKNWCFPYKSFSVPMAARSQASHLATKDSSLQNRIWAGQFDICAENGVSFPPALWQQFVKPGKRLEMVMWSEDPPSVANPSASLGKLVLQRLFTLRRRRRRTAQRIGIMAPPVQTMGPMESNRIPGGVPNLGDDERSVECPTCIIDNGYPTTGQDQQSSYRSCRSDRSHEVESQEMEFDDEDLFGFDDGEEDYPDTVENFGDLLARWTNADKK